MGVPLLTALLHRRPWPPDVLKLALTTSSYCGKGTNTPSQFPPFSWFPAAAPDPPVRSLNLQPSPTECRNPKTGICSSALGFQGNEALLCQGCTSSPAMCHNPSTATTFIALGSTPSFIRSSDYLMYL